MTGAVQDNAKSLGPWTALGVFFITVKIGNILWVYKLTTFRIQKKLQINNLVFFFKNKETGEHILELEHLATLYL